MTKKEYAAALAAIRRYNDKAIGAAAVEIKKVLLAACKTALKTKVFPREIVEEAINRIYRDTKYKAADKVQALEIKYVLDALESRGYKELDMGIYASKKDTAMTSELSQALWVMNGDGDMIRVSDYVKTKFTHKYDLSPNVWKTDEMEARVYAVIDGGRALGRDVKDIGKDLETFVKYKDGGKRVIGRWGAQMGSAYKSDGTRDEKKIEQGWERAYIQKLNEESEVTPGSAGLDGGYIEYGSAEARRHLDTPHAQAWIKTHSISDKTGKLLLPPEARAYSNRLGKSGLDYRVIRTIRTESQQSYCDRLYDKAQNSLGGPRKVQRVLAQHRDAWGCECVKAARWINEGEGGGRTVSEIKEKNPKWLAPMHPNCECYDRPIFLSPDELVDEILKM